MELHGQKAVYREEFKPTVLPAAAVWQQRCKSPTKSMHGQWRAPPTSLICLSWRVDEGARRHSEEDSTQPAMTSRPIASVKPQTSAGLTPLKSSQKAEEERTRSHSCNRKQQVNHLEDRTPILAPWGFPSHSDLAPHKPGHLHNTGQRCQPGTWEQRGCTSAAL